MTAEDHVSVIHLLSEKNPRPVIAAFHFTPRSGRAEVTTRIRLNGSQHIMALARMADGSYWSDTAEVISTATACIDDT
jgi:sulfur-oxidizing protein SoxY